MAFGTSTIVTVSEWDEAFEENDSEKHRYSVTCFVERSCLV